MKRILICDDDESIMEIIQIVLRDRGYDTLVLTNGRQIESRVASFRPHVILLDLWMPDIKGDVIAAKLKGNHATSNIPLVIISANRETEVIAKTTGADAFLFKPFDIEDLESTVEHVLRRAVAA